MNKNLINQADRIALLQTWVRIVEAGSLSAAARQMDTSQPTISRRLKALEQRLNCKLLLRTTHQIKLTEDGENCYQQAKILLEQWQSIEDRLNQTDTQLTGHLRVRAPHAFGKEQLLEPLLSYLAHHPNMRIDWQLHDKTPNFIADNIDCAIHLGPVTEPNVVAELVAHVPRIIVAAPTLVKTPPIQIESLQDYPWIAFSNFYRHELTLTEQTTHTRCSLTLNPTLATDNIDVAARAAIAGVGLAMLSAWLVEPMLARGELIQLMPQWQATSLPLYLVYPYANYYPARLRQFLEAMRHGIKHMSGIEPKTRRSDR
ncbi:LysR family transcriptional regulator [Celerinatantimonas yamalensis]|uniref:LysR family transcriptional regulator n=1 Tax=Celerinatantimonas yamalensis TaxID=559956 RepID=A0ABW9G5M0_9GAMM